jgi:hypothetical protein
MFKSPGATNWVAGSGLAKLLTIAGCLLSPAALAEYDLEDIYPTPDPYLGEELREHELKAARGLITTLEEKISSEYSPGNARRDAHPKAHGCVAATFTVNDNISPELAHGVFKPGASYDALLRFSNGSPNATGKDISGDTRGMAIKLYDVPGEKLFSSPGQKNAQDFILISSPFFFINSAEGYTDFFERVDSGSTWQLWKIPFILGWQGSYNAYKMLSQQIANPVETRYWSVVPYQLGLGEQRQAVKYSARPCTEGSSTIPDNPGDNYLREAMVKTLAAGPACMEFMIQPRTGDMSVEDAITEWSEEEAPFQPVAQLILHQQVFDTPEQNQACENESYNPWHALPAHKPLGLVSRLRRVVYQAISDLRHEMNAPPEVQPVPEDWTAEQARRRQAKAAYLAEKQEAFDWFARFPFSEVDGIPLIILKLLPQLAPDLWGEGDELMSAVGLFRDSRYPERFLPSGVGFSGLSRKDPTANIDYTSFTCAACHIGRVRTGEGEWHHIDGGINAEFNINLFFVKLHQTLARLYQNEEDQNGVDQNGEGGDEQDPARRHALVTKAILDALDRATATSPTFFYENFRWQGRHFDAAYEAQQIALFRAEAEEYVAAFMDYAEGFAAAFAIYLDKTYPGFQSEMLAGLPGMADATGVSAIHGYESLQSSVTGRLLASHVLPESPGLTDFMAVWEQKSRTAEWDPSAQHLINGGGQYNGNIPIPMFRNMAASLTMALKDTDLRVAAFSAELLDGLPATVYPFAVDENLAREGEALFTRHCADCHRPNNGQVYHQLGTSPARSRVINTLLMEGARKEYTSLCSPDTTVEMYGRQVKPCAEFKGVSLAGKSHMAMRPLDEQRGYNATALKGVWAMAPYLHNGSVPTIYHLLMPQTRPSRFVKSRLDYDQKKLGFAWETEQGEGGYVLDTSTFHAISNKGHDTDITLDGTTYRLDWSDDPQGAAALIEYLKTL